MTNKEHAKNIMSILSPIWTLYWVSRGISMNDAIKSVEQYLDTIMPKPPVICAKKETLEWLSKSFVMARCIYPTKTLTRSKIYLIRIKTKRQYVHINDYSFKAACLINDNGMYIEVSIERFNIESTNPKLVKKKSIFDK